MSFRRSGSPSTSLRGTCRRSARDWTSRWPAVCWRPASSCRRSAWTRTRCSASWRSTAACGPARARSRWRRRARRGGWPRSCWRPQRAREAMLVDGLAVAAAGELTSAVRVLSGGPPDPLPDAGRTPRRAPARRRALARPERSARAAPRGASADRGGGGRAQLPAERLARAPARRCSPSELPSILPQLSRPEAIEVTRIHSIAGEHRGRAGAEQAVQGAAPFDHDRRAGRRRAQGLGRRGRARPPRACCSWTSSRSSPSRRSRRCASRWRTGAWRSSGPGTRRCIRRGSCCSRRPTRARAGMRATTNGAGAAKPTWRATGAS